MIGITDRWVREDLQDELRLSDDDVAEIENHYCGQFRENVIEYSLFLLRAGADKAAAVTLLQDELHLARPDAIRIVNTPGGLIADHLPPPVARRLEGQLRSCGAETRLTMDLTRLHVGRRVSFDFVWIPRGRFLMGDSTGADDEKPAHEVKIHRGFWMGRTPVTQFQWERIMGGNPSAFRGPTHPVETVSWLDCRDFIARLVEISGARPLRLPREEKWEYACRAGSQGPYYWGQVMDADRCAWLGNSLRGTQPVASYLANDWGLFDMLGNVWEWCEDVYREDAYLRKTGAGEDAEEEQLRPRVTRGGSWMKRNAVAPPPGAVRRSMTGVSASVSVWLWTGWADSGIFPSRSELAPRSRPGYTDSNEFSKK